MRVSRSLALTALALAAVACSSADPGALEGTWKVTDPIPVTVTFREGEMEAMGITKKVTYQPKGHEVLVTHQEGATKGLTFSYEVVDNDTIVSESGTFHRVQGRR